WRRLVFNIAVSNTDDHLRNHGFILRSEGWELAPAYDLNPSVDKMGLALNIDMDNNDLNFELAKSIGVYCRLDEDKMNFILRDVFDSVCQWSALANDIGISKVEQDLMRLAFKTEI